MKKNVMEEYSKNARNMTERNMKRKYGGRGICLSQTQFREGQLKRFFAECCYASDNFIYLEMYRDCSIIGEKYCQMLQWYRIVWQVDHIFYSLALDCV